MHLHLLHLDGALKTQPLFLAQCRALQAREIDAPAADIRLWGKDAQLESLRMRLLPEYRNPSATTVTFMGSGDFHHVSALLIGMLAEEKLTVIHFDNHPDWVHFSGGMHCGSWVNRALALPQVERIITIGVCSRDLRWPQFKGANLDALKDKKIILLPWRSPGKRFRSRDIADMEQGEFAEKLAALIPTRNVYITIDKDVLARDEAVTNWDQGQMRLDYLLATLRSILAQHHAIGIDVTGDYSPPQYGGNYAQIALKKLEALIDQPRAVPQNATAINQAGNIALLNCIREAA